LTDSTFWQHVHITSNSQLFQLSKTDHVHSKQTAGTVEMWVESGVPFCMKNVPNVTTLRLQQHNTFVDLSFHVCSWHLHQINSWNTGGWRGLSPPTTLVFSLQPWCWAPPHESL